MKRAACQSGPPSRLTPCPPPEIASTSLAPPLRPSIDSETIEPTKWDTRPNGIGETRAISAQFRPRRHPARGEGESTCRLRRSVGTPREGRRAPRRQERQGGGGG